MSRTDAVTPPDEIALAAAHCARDALRALHPALPVGYRPAGHCYALSRVTALLLNRIGYADVRCVVGHVDGRDWLQETYPAMPHAWVECGPWRFDPKSRLAFHVYKTGPIYENYVLLDGENAARLCTRFLNACGVEEGVFDVVVDACERVIEATKEAA